MYEKTLIQAGLTETQAEVYDYLLGQKELKASDIAKNTKRPRGVVYKALDDLFLLGLVEKLENKGIARFRAEHPSNLEKVLEKKENKAKKELEVRNVRLNREKEGVINTLPELITQFNQVNNKPAFRYYDGAEGLIEALNYLAQKFKPDTEVISFVKVVSLEADKDSNQQFESYIAKRKNKNVRTRVISINDEEGELLKARDFSMLRETRLVEVDKIKLDFPGGEILIYGDDIVFVTSENNRQFAFTMQSKSLAQLLTAFFESEWALLA